jgi:putative hemolysin
MKRILIVTLILGTLILAACGAEPTPTPAPTAVPVEPAPTVSPEDTTFESPLDMANPASVFCVEQGYTLEIRDEAGGQVGYCIFPNGAECEEWAFFRGECTVPESYP